jgi:hypothetical protein
MASAPRGRVGKEEEVDAETDALLKRVQALSVAK